MEILESSGDDIHKAADLLTLEMLVDIRDELGRMVNTLESMASTIRYK